MGYTGRFNTWLVTLSAQITLTHGVKLTTDVNTARIFSRAPYWSECLCVRAWKHRDLCFKFIYPSLSLSFKEHYPPRSELQKLCENSDRGSTWLRVLWLQSRITDGAVPRKNKWRYFSLNFNGCYNTWDIYIYVNTVIHTACHYFFQQRRNLF